MYSLTGLPTPVSTLKKKKKKESMTKTIIDLYENDPRWYLKQGEEKDVHLFG